MNTPAPRRLQGVQPTGDDRWPWQATDADPQFCFDAPPGRRDFRVTVHLDAEHGAPAPVVYFHSGAGYRAAQTAPMSHLGDGVWTAECHPSTECRAWRLDPLDRPGRFRLDGLRVEPLPRAPARPAWLARAGEQLGAAVDRLRTSWGSDDLVAGADVTRADGIRRHLATGTDPQFHLRRPLPAGWYMVEVRLALPAARAVARLYLDEGRGEDEQASLGLPLRSGVLAKRLVRLAAPARLRFDPMACRGEFAIEHFRIARVGTGFARERMLRKLRVHHPRHRQAAPDAPPPGPAQDDALWADYDALFSRQDQSAARYEDWIREVEAPAIPDARAQREQAAGWAWTPCISLVMPTWNSPIEALQACLDRVEAQGYPHWELCIADDASTDPEVRRVLGERAAREPRIRLALREANGHIAEASNTALALARGEFVALLDHDDLLAPHALWAVAEALQARPQAQLLYSDEDKLDEAGRRCEPFLKPDWMPDLLRAQNFVSHLGVYRRALVEAVGGFRRGYEGSQDHDLALRCIERIADPRDIVHIPRVLYHWRMAEGSTARGHGEKDYASEAGRRAVQDHLDRTAPGATAEIVAPGIYRTRWPLPATPPRVSLIVPTRDGHDLLRTCVDSIVARTRYPDYEILVVDNQSACPRTLAYMADLDAGREGGGRARVLRWPHPFNYSAINNFAATHATGTVLGLVNNDIEVIGEGWLEEMVSQALRPDIGCVGAKLYYPDDTIQHAGVTLGIGGVANHLMRGLPRGAPGYFGRLWTAWNPSAVTAAALLLRREVWDAAGGLDAQGLPVAFNDVDLCLKVRALGLRNLWTPHAELYHHESVSRGADETPAKRARFLGEVETMLRRWGPELARDPAYHPHLTRLREDCSLAMPGETVPHAAGEPS